MNPALMMLMRGPVAAGGRTLTYIGATGSSDNLTTYNLTDVPIGDADATRSVVLVVMTYSQAPRVISSATIGGVTGTVDLDHAVTNDGGNNYATTAFVRAAVPTGTTANISLTYSTGALRVIVFVYTFTGGPVSVADTGTDASSTLASATVTGVTGGGIIAGCNDALTPTWGGVTSDGSATYELSGSVASGTSVGATTVTAAVAEAIGLAVVAYQPA